MSEIKQKPTAECVTALFLDLYRMAGQLSVTASRKKDSKRWEYHLREQDEHVAIGVQKESAEDYAGEACALLAGITCAVGLIAVGVTEKSSAGRIAEESAS